MSFTSWLLANSYTNKLISFPWETLLNRRSLLSPTQTDHVNKFNAYAKRYEKLPALNDVLKRTVYTVLRETPGAPGRKKRQCLPSLARGPTFFWVGDSAFIFTESRTSTRPVPHFDRRQGWKTPILSPLFLWASRKIAFLYNAIIAGGPPFLHIA